MSVFENIKDAALRLDSIGLISAGSTVIAVRVKESFFITAPSAELLNLDERDVSKYPVSGQDSGKRSGELETVIGAVFSSRQDAGAVIISAPEYLLSLSEKEVHIPPILDDFAQIIGPTMRVAEDGEKLLSALKGRNGVLIKNRGALTLGRTLDEATTALMVSEKAAKTLVLAGFIGKPRPIPFWQAKLMNFIYKKKYSKKDQSQKIESQK